MAKLTREQLKFLNAHSIPMSRVLDASGMKPREWKLVMEELDFWFCFGCSKCKAAGHELRSRSNHCIQCRPAVIAFQNRYFTAGEVYVAHSRKTGIVKIGTSKISQSRVLQLNGYAYGGAQDWEIEFTQACAEAGKIEFEAQRLLALKACCGTYFKNGHDIECRELFKCTTSAAIAAVRKAVKTYVNS